MNFLYRIVPAVAVALIISGCATMETATTAKSQHFDAGQRQEEVIIPSASFYEACDKLSLGQQVEYSFTISKPVHFNVYYYNAEGVHYPVEKENIDTMRGVFSAAVNATYCCMWSNRQAVPVSLIYDFRILDE